ncbi:MAG: flagellar motor protein, partial [Syntrophobacterales bacterium]
PTPIKFMDRTTLFGLLLGGLSLVVGYYLEGGSAGMVFQITAAVIVLGGTLGAVCLSFTGPQLGQSWRSLAHIFRKPRDDTYDQVARLVGLSYRARREGLLALEPEVGKLTDAFLRRGLQLVVDGFSPQEVRDIMELDLAQQGESGRMPARVFEAAGGYAPTIGIIGAVLGLIQVMQHLTDPARLGTGVAVAFVATIYGVASANLIFLPMAHKLKLRHEQQMLRQEMLLEGILALAQGEHPRVIAERLSGFIPETTISPAKPPALRPVRPLSLRSRGRAKSHASSSVRSH